MKKLIIISFLFTSLFLKAQNQDVRQSARKLEEVLTYINHLYVDDVNNNKLTEAAIIATLEKLDPHCSYISKEDVENKKINPDHLKYIYLHYNKTIHFFHFN